jgi:hypothetical protein
MSDIDPATAADAEADASVHVPAVVPASPIGGQANDAAATFLIVLGAMSALGGFVSKHDWWGALTWLQSSAAIPFVGVAVASIAFWWKQAGIRYRSKQRATFASLLPNEVSMVSGTLPPDVQASVTAAIARSPTLQQQHN